MLIVVLRGRVPVALSVPELKQVRHADTGKVSGSLITSGDKARVSNYRARAAIDNMEETV